jgi:hypothetical protein
MKNLFNKYYNFILVFLIILIIVTFFDKVLAVGLLFLMLLTSVVFLIISKLGLNYRSLFLLLSISLVIHLLAVLFIYYFDFQPFGGGSGGYNTCNTIAIELSKNFRSGNFSFEGVPYYEIGEHPYRYYSLLVGILYTVAMPEMLIGQIFQVWLSILAALFVYLIVLELSKSKIWAFLIGLISTIYPSYLFYSSLLLKDGLVVVLVLASLLFILKIIKNFSWGKFIIFYLILAAIFNFRFYFAYALVFSFLFSWFFLLKLNLKKKIIYSIIIILLLGFLPDILLGHGFFGVGIIRETFNEENVTFYQQEAYRPSVQVETEDINSSENTNSSELPAGFESTWDREEVNFKSDFLKSLISYSKYFSYILFGPFFWQLNKPLHFFVLLETIPWYIIFFFIVKGVYRSITNRNKFILPIIIFSLLLLAVITIIVNNYGIITRIRIPAFMALLCLMPLAFKKCLKK